MDARYDPDQDLEDFDDLPSTDFTDDEYDRYLASEFDGEGRWRAEPPVVFWIGIGVVALVALALWLFL